MVAELDLDDVAAQSRLAQHELYELRKDAEQWRARFAWLAGQHWVEPEAKFRLDLRDTEFSNQYMAELIVAVDAKLTPNVPPTPAPMGQEP
jgi:hypothetical protein